MQLSERPWRARPDHTYARQLVARFSMFKFDPRSRFKWFTEGLGSSSPGRVHTLPCARSWVLASGPRESTMDSNKERTGKMKWCCGVSPSLPVKKRRRKPRGQEDSLADQHGADLRAQLSPKEFLWGSTVRAQGPARHGLPATHRSPQARWAPRPGPSPVWRPPPASASGSAWN